MIACLTKERRGSGEWQLGRTDLWADVYVKLLVHEVSTYAELNVWLIDTERSRYAGCPMRQQQWEHYELARPRHSVNRDFPEGLAYPQHTMTVCHLGLWAVTGGSVPRHPVDTFFGICRRMGYCHQDVGLPVWKTIAWKPRGAIFA